VAGIQVRGKKNKRTKKKRNGRVGRRYLQEKTSKVGTNFILNLLWSVGRPNGKGKNREISGGIKC